MVVANRARSGGGRRHGSCKRHLSHIVGDSKEHSEEVVLQRGETVSCWLVAASAEASEKSHNVADSARPKVAQAEQAFSAYMRWLLSYTEGGRSSFPYHCHRSSSNLL